MPIAALLRCAAPIAALVFAAGAAASPGPTGELRRPAAAVAAPAATPDFGRGVAPGLAKRLAAGQPVDYVIEMSARADLSHAAGMSWQERGRYVVDTLRSTAEKSQAPVRRALQQRGLSFETHWIKNVILVRGGDAASVKFAVALPGVARLRELPETLLVKPRPGKPVDPARAKGAATGVPDNIAWIGAPQAWAQGTRGHGVTVGVIDTGALYTHEALRQQYRGWRGGNVYEHDYNWFFPLQRSPAPVAGDPHGTHVIGTVMGDDHDADPALRDRIGVAPGAQWIACLGLPQSTSGSAASLLACGEFMLAPTRTDGTDPQPDLRPQVVNNSWSENNCNGEATDFYADLVEAWVASGIFPVFATGNTSGCEVSEPPGLSTISSPAALPAAFAVGSTGNHDGAYAPHSLWGPSSQAITGTENPPLPDPHGFPRMKPQVMAPGVDIVSAFDFTDDAYGTMTGTSMSSPHIAGLVALMLDAGECLAGDYATLGTLIMETARPLPYASGGTPAPGPGNVPNYATGWGEIDVPAAVSAAADECGPQGLIAGTLTDAGGHPVGNARLELFVDETVRVWELFSEPDGSYARRLPENLAGGYTLRVTAYGFLPYTRTGLPVTDDQTTTADVQLETAPLATLSGRVTDAATGWPLLAKLAISGYPGGEVWTDGATGAYEVQLPTAASYRIDVASDIEGYLPATRQVNVAADAVQDFALAADLVACSAPGYGYTAQRFDEAFETGTPPAGWSTSSNGAGWTFGTREELDQPQFFHIPPRDGRFAASIEPAPEPNGENDGRFDYLVSPPFDLTGAAQPVVRFASRYWASGLDYGGAHVQARAGAGGEWQSLGSPEQFEPAWTEEALSLAAFAGSSDVQLRFHYDDGSTADEDVFNPGWLVDDVRVVAGCQAPANGSLVIGHVRDANTQAALDGARVSVGGRSVSTRTSAARGAGFFAIHAPAGNATLTATRGTQPEGYGDGERALVVGDDVTLETTIDLPAGVLEFDAPQGPQATLQLGTTASVPFTLRNGGTRGLHVALEGTHLEEHFDALQFPPAGWSASDNGGACTWQRGDFGNGAGGDGPFAQIDLSPCYGGQPRVDLSLALPPVDLSDSASASLGFFLGLGAGWLAEPRFAVEVSTDAGQTWAAVREWDYGNAGHELIEIDLTAFAGQADVRLRFRLEAEPPYATLAIDQVHVFREIGEDTAVDVAPAQATLAPGAQIVADALFDARQVAQPGTYTIPIRVGEDTPYMHAFGDLNATMIVTTPATYGSIAGTVRSLGRCSADPQPFADLELRIVAGNGVEFTTRTDVDGHYRYFVDAALGPYTVRAEGEAHEAVERSGVQVTAGNQTAADFDLRPLAACLATDPAVLHLSANAGGQALDVFHLANLGPIAAAYTARAGGDPSQLSPLRLTQNDEAGAVKDASVACVLPATEHTLENRWYRVYPLAGRGYAGDQLFIDGIRFGADNARSVAGTQEVVVSAYTLQGEFTRDNLTLLASKAVTLPDGELLMREALFDTPVAVPTDAVLVVEIAKLDGIATSSTFYPAGNFAADEASAWYYAPDCDTFTPTPYDELGFESLSPILDPIVRASDACGPAALPVNWLAAAPAAGNVAGDAELTLQATADATAFAPGTQYGAFCIAGPNASDRDLVLPVELHVDVPAGEEIFASGFE